LLETGVVFTNHALEQLGENWRPFLNLLLREKPSLVVHVEPIEEFYDITNLFDMTALIYHRKRNYLRNFFSHLQQLEQEKKIIIHTQQRMYFGSEEHEAYTIIVWEPL